MIETPPTHHATFTIERTYPVPPPHAFRAWADSAAKARWFAATKGWRSEGHQLDFREGGHERVDTVSLADGSLHAYRATYVDIVPERRIVYWYEMYVGEIRTSISLATVLFEPAGGDGTRLTFTEQVVMLTEEWDANAREVGTGVLLDNYGRELTRRAAP